MLQAMKRGQKWFEGTSQQGLCCFGALVRLKSRQTFCLKNPLGFVRKQNCITVKGNAHFVRVRFRRVCRVWVDLCSWHACVKCRTHI